jgi:hypothetical protein
VQVKRLIRRRIRKAGAGIDLVADLNAVVSVNTNETRRPSSEAGTGSPRPSRSDDSGLDNRGREQE